jgi:uncharacterized repeat protein (TIGR03806 family)
MPRLALLLCALALSAPVARAELRQRWSFNNPAGTIAAGLTIADSVSGAIATVVGAGPTGTNRASFTGTALRLPGSGTVVNPGAAAANAIFPYLDLPNGLLSSKTNLTVELWATPVAHLNNQRLFDFGRMSLTTGIGAGAAPGEVTASSTTAPGATNATNVDNLALNIGRSNLNGQRLEGRINGGAAVTGDTTLATPANTEVHYALVFESGVGAFPATGGRASWYAHGVLARAIDVNFRLANLEDVNNWLGRSQFTADPLARIDYNEVRFYDHAMRPAEIAASRAAGPNPTSLPDVQPDTITMNHGAKASLAVRDNDTNAVGLEIVQPPEHGTATFDAFGRILYTHTSGTPATDSFLYRGTNLAGASSPTTVTITFSSALRLPAAALRVPAAPPPAAYQVVEAFGDLAFTQPVAMATPPGETRRLFVAQQGGLVRMIPDVTAATPTASTFLDLPTLLTTRNLPAYPNESIVAGGERGLLGLAFHPNYATNGHFYVNYCVDKDSTTASPVFQRVSRFTVQAGNPNVANPASELILLEQLDDYGNHNGGDLHFGADGYLYITTGDEGDQNDTGNNSQRISKDFFCAILRIDVDKRPGNREPNAHPNPADYPSSPPADAVPRDGGVARYSVPIDNPYVHTDDGGSWTGSFNGAAIPAAQLPYVRSEIWASGFRNPWRMSFDPPTGDLWVGDVGGGQREEVDIVRRGENYGWALREGFSNGPKAAQAPANFDTLYGTRPIHDYPRVSGPTGGFSITGGIVYRGDRLPALAGAYLFADYVSGNIWSIRRSGTNGATPAERIAGEGGISAFAPDPSNGDVLMADLDNGRIRRLVGGVPTSGFPTTLGETGLFADLADLAPNPGLVGYDVNLPFWSDHGIKRRWFTIPDALGAMAWSRDGVWQFPTGQVWVKHFDLELTRGHPATRRRVETRLLVRTADGAYGVSYRWNDAQTDAALAPDEGVDIPFTINVGGTNTPQTWRIPSRSECLSCHTPAAGHALSSNTRQLNLSGIMNGFAGNQLTLLRNAGYFTHAPEPPNVLPRHLRPDETAFPLEARVRSYLDVNCAYCHQPGGTGAPAVWDGRATTPLDLTGLLHGGAANNGGDPLNKLIVPGDAAHSIVLHRMAVTNGFTRMPPLGSNVTDQTNIALVTQWIGSAELGNRQTYAAWRLAHFGSDTSPEGEPGSDADSDGSDNAGEFLAGSAPLDGASFPQTLVNDGPGGDVTVTLDVPANRTAQVETSLDLASWSLWDIPGNQGLAAPGGALSLTGPKLGPRQFFRWRLRGN